MLQGSPTHPHTLMTMTTPYAILHLQLTPKPYPCWSHSPCLAQTLQRRIPVCLPATQNHYRQMGCSTSIWLGLGEELKSSVTHKAVIRTSFREQYSCSDARWCALSVLQHCHQLLSHHRVSIKLRWFRVQFCYRFYRQVILVWLFSVCW